MASLRAMATLAIFRPRRIIRWKYLLRHSGMLRAVTWAASTNKKRNIELPCLVICPSRRRFPLESSNGHQSQITRDLLPTLKSFCSPDDQHESQCGQHTHSRMRPQTLRLGTLLHFLLDRLRQLRDHWIETVQQLQQVLSSPARPGSQPERLQLLASTFPPQSLLAA